MGRIRTALRRGRQPRVAIIGAGFGGLAAAVALRRNGDDIFIIERGDGVDGTRGGLCSACWNPKAQQWDLDLESVSSGGRFGLPADVVISAVGLFGEPKLPDIETVRSPPRSWPGSAEARGRRAG